MKKFLCILVGVIIGGVVMGGVWYFFDMSESITKRESKDVVQTKSYNRSDFHWLSRKVRDTDYGAPIYELSLNIHGTTYNMTDFLKGDDGILVGCTDGMSHTSEDRVITAYTCYWGGAGKEFAVLKDKSTYILAYKDIDEDVPSSEVRFKKIVDIK